MPGSGFIRKPKPIWTLILGPFVVGLGHACLEWVRLFGPRHGWAADETLLALAIEAILAMAVAVACVVPISLRWPRAWLGMSVAVVLGCQAGARIWCPLDAGGVSSLVQDSRGRTLVLVTTDTLRRDFVSAYPEAVHPGLTPHIDALASSGMRFDDAMAPAPITLPSHASMLSGQYPWEHGTLRNTMPLRTSVVGVPELLAKDGFRTGAFVSSLVLDRQMGLARWFEMYRDSPAPIRGIRQLWLAGIADRTVRDLFAISSDRSGKSSGDGTVRRALAWLDTLPQDASIFLWVHLYDVHEPHRDHGVPIVPVRDQLGHPCDWSAHPSALRRGAPQVMLPHRAPLPAEATCRSGQWQHMDDAVQSYAGEVQFVDAVVGSLVDGLKRRGRWDRAGIVLASDHGESLVEHQALVGHEYWLYDPVVRVPLVVRDPSCASCSGIRAEPVDTVRVGATLLQMAGLPTDSLPESRSLHEVADSPHLAISPVPDAGVSAPGGGGGPLLVAVRRGQRKVLVDETHHVERYDLAADPQELHPALTEEERRRLKDRVRSRVDNVPTAAGGELLPLMSMRTATEQDREALGQVGILGTSLESDNAPTYAPLLEDGRRVLQQAREAAIAHQTGSEGLSEDVMEGLRALGYVE